MSVDAGLQQSISPPKKEEAPPKEKTDVEKLNEETLKQQGAVDEKTFEGIKIVKGVFNGYKIGQESDFLSPPEDDTASKVGKGLETTAGVGAKASKITKGVLATAENKLEKWSGGNGIVGAALTVINYIKEAYNLMKNDKADDDENAAEVVKLTYGTAFDLAGNIIDAIENLGGTVLKAFKIIPGLGMVIDAIDACISAYKIMKADKARIRMNDSRRLFKQKYLNKKIESPAAGKGGSLVRETQGMEKLKFWKKTNITVDEETMKARRDQLLEKRKTQVGLTDGETEELRDIIKFLTQDRLRRKNRNKEISGVATIVKKVASITGKIAAMVGTFGGSLAAESIAGGIDLALDIADVSSTVMDLGVSSYQSRGGRDKGSQYTNYLLEVIASLPHQHQDPKDKSEYVQASEMVDATGADGTLVYKTAQAAEKATADADKKAGKAKAYKMFVDLFDG